MNRLRTLLGIGRELAIVGTAGCIASSRFGAGLSTPVGLATDGARRARQRRGPFQLTSQFSCTRYSVRELTVLSRWESTWATRALTCSGFSQSGRTSRSPLNRNLRSYSHFSGRAVPVAVSMAFPPQLGGSAAWQSPYGIWIALRSRMAAT